jgi:sulfide:quinone oxidoreductase
MDGRGKPGDGSRDRSRLAAAGIPFRQGVVDGIDFDGRSVRVDGDSVAYDFLVLALGCEPRMDLVKGEVSKHPNLYTSDGALAARDALRKLESGKVLIAIAGIPIKCPPAPYEAAFLIDDLLKKSGRRDRVSIEVVTPQPMSIPAAGPVACTNVEGRMGQRGIAFHNSTPIDSVTADGVVAGGETLSADLLILVPPHRPPAAVGQWVTVDPATLATDRDEVFAIGDLVEMKTGAGLPFPKAGIFAEQHGAVVAAKIAGKEAKFTGDGYCWLETGNGEATMVKGNFFSSPPDVAIAEPSAENLTAKLDFERERLERWLP